MTVFTTGSKGGRVYHFELVGREAYGINDEDLVFLVKFIYPDGKIVRCKHLEGKLLD